MKHEKVKKNLKLIGFICLGIGAVLTVTAFVSFFRSVGSRSGEFPRLFFLGFIGLPLIGIGAMLLSLGYRGELMKYAKNEAVPIVNETGKEISPAIRAVASAVAEAKEESTNFIVCKDCGEKNPADGKFCKNCGKALYRVCPHCGKEIPEEGSFCNYCGEKIEK